jgi:hypothetical protein
MGITEFLLKLVTDEELARAFQSSDESLRDEQQRLIDEHELSREDQQLLADRDLSALRVKVKAEFELDQDDAAAIWTIYAAPGTIYIPPPPPPTAS